VLAVNTLKAEDQPKSSTQRTSRGWGRAQQTLHHSAFNLICDQRSRASDIDPFKSVNDSFGHLFGDRVRRAVPQVRKANTKGRDVTARYGGEEFGLLLPQTTSGETMTLRIRCVSTRSAATNGNSCHYLDAGSVTV
jgi:diguanylate cyclase (GGDEF)-like protein